MLMLPINRTVVMQLTSRDVIHSFTLPEMRVKQDATPGMTSRTWFTPIATGDLGDRLLAAVRPRALPHAR